MKKIHLNKNIKYFGLLVTILLFVYTFNITTGRYTGEITSTESIAAQPILTLSNNGQTFKLENMIPGQTQSYTFSVSNTDKDMTNELLLKYYFKITNETDIPLTIKLYDITSGGNTEIPIKNGQTDPIEMPYETSVTRNYKVEFIWNAKDNSYEYANKQITCKIELNAEQV